MVIIFQDFQGGSGFDFFCGQVNESLFEWPVLFYHEYGVAVHGVGGVGEDVDGVADVAGGGEDVDGEGFGGGSREFWVVAGLEVLCAFCAKLALVKGEHEGFLVSG